MVLGVGSLSEAAKSVYQVASSGQEAIAVGAADHLNYRLFTDSRGKAMKKFGVAYEAHNNTVTNCKRQFNVDLESSSGPTHHILAVPAVFIVDRGSNIVFVRADPDYKLRMKGAEVLAVAKAAATTFDAPRK